uniref:Uncharacterized protein n=1 Tax=Trichogramma kaykai TaxID=54128 RepID=A0ABD2W5T1_9HYME
MTEKHLDININGEIVKVSTDQLKLAYFLGDEEDGVGDDELLTDSQRLAATASMVAAGNYVLEDNQVSRVPAQQGSQFPPQQASLVPPLQVSRVPSQPNIQVPSQCDGTRDLSFSTHRLIAESRSLVPVPIHGSANRFSLHKIHRTAQVRLTLNNNICPCRS